MSSTKAGFTSLLSTFENTLSILTLVVRVTDSIVYLLLQRRWTEGRRCTSADFVHRAEGCLGDRRCSWRRRAHSAAAGRRGALTKREDLLSNGPGIGCVIRLRVRGSQVSHQRVCLCCVRAASGTLWRVAGRPSSPAVALRLVGAGLAVEGGLSTAARRWNEVVRHGVVPEWLPSRPARQPSRPRNHSSIDEHLSQVWAHIRKGQADGRYLVVRASLLDQWHDIFLSPIGVVAKDGTDIRVIDDYSFPEGSSINDFTDRSHLPAIKYNPPADIARRIVELRREYPDIRILLMLGDVAGAFRHVPVSADHAHMFAFVLGEYLVVDLACGFGWCGSPAWYFLPGTLINGLYEESPCATTAVSRPLTGLFWCDDHTCIEPEDGLRCFKANLALRRAMATVLGPKAINTRKFKWSEQGRALGLLWDTRAGTLTIPAEKISKAQQRVQALLDGGTTTKTNLLQLLGSLRHVASCCPQARAFYQRLQTAANTSRRYGRHQLSADAFQDLHWFRYILLRPSRFNGIPISQSG